MARRPQSPSRASHNTVIGFAAAQEFAGGPAAGSSENTQCRLDAAGTTRTIIGNDILLTVRLTFKPAFKGLKILYGGVQSFTANSNWHVLGAWTAP